MRNGGTGADFDPYHKWLGIAPAEQPPDHYRLLGVPQFESDLVVIDAAADRALTFLRKHQSGEYRQQANDLLNEVTRAWRCLAKPETKAKYDATLRAAADDDIHEDFEDLGAKQRTRPQSGQNPAIIWGGIGIAGLVTIVAIVAFALRTPGPVANPAPIPDPGGAPQVASLTPNSLPAATQQAESATPAPTLPAPSDPPAKPVVTVLNPATTPEPVIASSDVVTLEAIAEKLEPQAEPKPSGPKPREPARAASELAYDYHLPERVSVLPVAFIPKDQKPPTPGEKTKFLKHINLAQARYRELLGGDTFEIAKQEVEVVRGAKPLDFYRPPPDRGAPEIVSELLAHLKVNRYQCPYVFCILLMNSVDSFPEGGGRPINGGLNTGCGMMYIASGELTRNEHFQATLQHELGHGFGLPHVDVYGYNIQTSSSLMSYNPAHFTKGFEPSPTPGKLIPEDRRALALNKRVFSKFPFDPKRDVPPDYVEMKKIVTLGPMTLPDQPEFYPTLTSQTGLIATQKVDICVREEIRPSIGPEINFDMTSMWHSARNLQGYDGNIEITFPFPVRLSGISVHSEIGARGHAAHGIRVQTMENSQRKMVVDRPLTKVNELVSFPAAISQKWMLNFKGDETGTFVIRGLRFFDQGAEVFPHQVPYRSVEGVDDIAPSRKSPLPQVVAQNGPKTNAGTQAPAKDLPVKDPPATGPAAGAEKPLEGALTAAGKAAVPTAAAQADARKELKEKFKTEYAQARKPDGKEVLARTLIAHAAEPDVGAAQRYVALLDALDTAAEGGSLASAEEALDALVTHFSVSPLALKQRIVSAAAATVKTRDDALPLLVQYLDIAREAAVGDDYTTCLTTMQAAVSALKKPAFKDLQDFAKVELKRYTGYRDAFDVAKLARDKLEKDSADEKASLTWGRYLCFYKEDWEHGLPLLVQSGDKVWKSLAERELNQPTDPQLLLKLATDWLDAGEKEKDPVRYQTRERADAAFKSITGTSSITSLDSIKATEQPKMRQALDRLTTRMFDKSVLVSSSPQGTQVPDTEKLNPTENFTIEFWAMTQMKRGIMLTKVQGGTDRTVRIHLALSSTNDPLIGFDIATVGGSGGTGGPNSFSDGHWHHFAIVKQGAQLQMYADGQRSMSLTVKPDEPLISASPWKLGAAGSAGDGPFQGTFARVRISNMARYKDSFTPRKQFVRDAWTTYLK